MGDNPAINAGITVKCTAVITITIRLFVQSDNIFPYDSVDMKNSPVTVQIIVQINIGSVAVACGDGMHNLVTHFNIINKIRYTSLYSLTTT